MTKLCCAYGALVDMAMGKVKKFTFFDFAMMKACLLSMGLFLGIKFSKKLERAQRGIGIVALVSYLYMAYKILARDTASR